MQKYVSLTCSYPGWYLEYAVDDRIQRDRMRKSWRRSFRLSPGCRCSSWLSFSCHFSLYNVIFNEMLVKMFSQMPGNLSLVRTAAGIHVLYDVVGVGWIWYMVFGGLIFQCFPSFFWCVRLHLGGIE